MTSNNKKSLFNSLRIQRGPDKSPLIPHSKPWITSEDIKIIMNLLSTGNIADGCKNQDFINGLQSYLSCKNIWLSGSGTEALILALRSLNLRKNDEIILPTYVCHSVLDAVIEVGAKPVICDIGPSWNMTKDSIEEKITSKTKGIIFVYIYGIPEKLEKVQDFGIPIIEDCCQAFGANVGVKPVGTIGDIGIFSFHATKCLTTGFGGAIALNNNRFFNRLNGICKKRDKFYKMTDMQAALGINQLKRYPLFIKKRKQIAENYLKNLPDDLIIEMNNVKEKSIFFRFLLTSHKIGDFTSVEKRFSKNGISIRHGVDALLHRSQRMSDCEFPNAVSSYNTTLSIPIYPGLSKTDQQKIIDVIWALSEKGEL